MKKLLASLCIVLALVMTFAPMSFASGLTVESISPKDGKTGLQVTNMAVKVEFNEDVSSEANDAVNQTKFVMTSEEDEEGNVTEYSYAAGNVKLVHSDKYPNELWYILDATLDANSEYKIVIEDGVVATSGNTLGSSYTSTFKTRNTKTDSLISVGMMVGMMVIMVMATSKAAKKAAAGQEEQKALAKKKEENLNPYKLAKEKNISLDEAKAYVEKEKAKLAKEREKEEAEARKREFERQAELDALEAKIEAELAAKRKEYVYHVKEASSITKTGRVVPKAVAKEKKKNAELKLAKEAALAAQREENNKGRKSKK